MCRRCDADPVDSIEWLSDKDVDCDGFDMPEGDEDEDGGDEEFAGPGDASDEEGGTAGAEEDDGDDDSDVDFCTRKARFRVHTRTVQDHLCAAHVAAARAHLAEGLSGFLSEARLADEHEFLPLEPGEEEACEECGAPATHVHVVGLSENLCREHAIEAGATIPPRPGD